MSGTPWIKFYPSDFLNGVADLDGECIGCYTIILALIWDRGQPIDDNSAWIARRCGVSTRNWNQRIKPKLMETGKIEVRDGLIGNRRALEEVEKRDQISDARRAAAFARWNAEEQPEFDLSPDYLENKSSFSGDKVDLISSKKQHKSQKPAKNPHADAFSTRARARSRDQSPESNKRTNLTTPARKRLNGKEPQVRLDDQSIDLVFGVICEAAGHSPPDDMIDRSKDFIRKWKDAGISVDQVIMPTIRRIMAKTPDPVTSSLKRFDRDIMGAQAQASARAAQPAPSIAQASLFEFDGEAPEIVPLRKAVEKAIGPSRYALLAHKTKFALENGVVQLHGDWANTLKDEIGAVRLKRIANRLGFLDIW
jgi:uncharacterized protein YdaU (DUF1376 family)